MSLSLLRTLPADLGPDTGSYTAIVVKTDPLMVFLPGFDRVHEWGPCILLAGGAEPPAPGDTALVTITPDATLWLHQVAA